MQRQEPRNKGQPGVPIAKGKEDKRHNDWENDAEHNKHHGIIRGELLEIRLRDGEMTAQVESVRKGEEI